MTQEEYERILDEIQDLNYRIKDLESDNRYLQSDVEDLNDRLYTFENESR